MCLRQNVRKAFSLVFLRRAGQADKADRAGVCVYVFGGLSWPAALDEAWVEAHVSNVVTVEQPGEETFEAEPVSTMRTCPILPLKLTKDACLVLMVMLKAQ